MTMKKIARYLPPLVAVFLPLVTLAQSTQSQFVPLANYQGSRQFQSAFRATSLSQYLNALFQISLSVGAILAVVMIVYGGYLYMGSDMWANKQKAKQVITDAIIGLLLLLAIYLILFQIDRNILSLKITSLGN